MREYLEALDGESLEQALPKNLSLTDPQARWTAAPGGPAFYAYSTNYLGDTEHGVIVDVAATPAHRTAELESAKTMVNRVEERFELVPERLIGDTAYGTAPMLAWMVEDKGIAPHVPVWDRTQRDDETLSSSDFQWNERADEYRCPQGHALRRQWRAFKNPRTRITKADTIRSPTKNLLAVQLLLGHTKLESTVRYLGVEVDDALEKAEQTEVRVVHGRSSAMGGDRPSTAAGDGRLPGT